MDGIRAGRARTSARVDVLIPAYNAAATIAESVGSIQRQTVRDIRIVVVNDGSTDATGSILAGLASQDARIEVVTRPNGGIVEALNSGLAVCTSELIARHDADDLAFPDRLDVQCRFLDAHPDCVAVDSHYWHINDEGKRTDLRNLTAGDVDPIPTMVPSQEPYLMHPFLTVRAAPVHAVGGYRYVFHSEDTDLYWRLLPFGRLHHIASVLGEYRIHGGSISSASVLNGRIAAVNAQLAAVSHLRRAAGKPDILFPREMLDRYKAAGSLRRIIDVAAEQLTSDEAGYLAAATAAKLVELSLFRPYLPDDEDAATIADALRDNRRLLSPSNRQHVEAMRGKLAVRLLRRQRYKAAALLSPGLVPMARVLGHKAVRRLRRPKAVI